MKTFTEPEVEVIRGLSNSMFNSFSYCASFYCSDSGGQGSGGKKTPANVCSLHAHPDIIYLIPSEYIHRPWTTITIKNLQSTLTLLKKNQANQTDGYHLIWDKVQKLIKMYLIHIAMLWQTLLVG